MNEEQPGVFIADPAGATLIQGVVRRTSIHIESVPVDSIEDTRVQTVFAFGEGYHECTAFADYVGKDKGTLHKVLTKWSSLSSSNLDDKISASYSSAKPQTAPRQGIQGLERAASLKEWAGKGRPAEAWGKLRQDPALWDPDGDTLVYLGRTYTEPSFCIQSDIIQETRSPFLMRLLRGHDIGSEHKSCEVRTTSISETHEPLSTRKASLPKAAYKKIFLDAPQEVSKLDILRHHIATRNFFALLCNRSLVGYTFYQALVDLYERLQAYLPPDIDCAGVLITYLMINQLHDVRNDPGAAAGMLAWSEEPNVYWPEGWREGFVHSVGMYHHLKLLPELRDLSPPSRELLERSHAELKIRVEEAAERLTVFRNVGNWLAGSMLPADLWLVIDSFQRFLKVYYTGVWKTWPPKLPRHSGSTWLNRSIVARLQQDLGALYKCCVQENVTWDHLGLQNVGHTPRSQTITPAINRFHIDSGDLRMIHLVLEFDNQYAYAHIPRPLPLLPVLAAPEHTPKKSFLGFQKPKNRAVSSRIANAYLEATNLPTQKAHNGLVNAFLSFETSDLLGEIDPRDARRARWLVLYCTLQVLANVSVDSPGLWFTDDVEYFLNAHLKGMPTLEPSTKGGFKEATREQSVCWNL